MVSQAVDIFASFTTSADNRLTIMKYIAKMWAAPISAAETLYPVNKPVIQVLTIPHAMWYLYGDTLSPVYHSCNVLAGIAL